MKIELNYTFGFDYEWNTLSQTYVLYVVVRDRERLISNLEYQFDKKPSFEDCYRCALEVLEAEIQRNLSKKVLRDNNLANNSYHPEQGQDDHIKALEYMWRGRVSTEEEVSNFVEKLENLRFLAIMSKGYNEN